MLAAVPARAWVFINLPETASEAGLFIEHSGPSAPETRVDVAVLEPIEVTQFVLTWTGRDFNVREPSVFRFDCPEFSTLILA